MNEIAVLESNPSADAGSSYPESALNGLGGYELFGLGWSPGSTAGEYVGRHRAIDA